MNTLLLSPPRYAGLAALVCAAALLAGPGPLARNTIEAPSADKKHVADLEAFVKAIDREYPFLREKGIEDDWNKVKKDLLKRARKCADDEEFVELLVEAMSCLRDGHMSFTKLEVKMKPRPEFFPGISFLPATEERVVVIASAAEHRRDLPPGTVVAKIEGKDARKWIEERGATSWKKGGFFSSPQRARFFEYRIPLRGERGEKFEIHYLDGKRLKRTTLRANLEVDGWPHTYNLPEGLDQGARSVWHGRLGDFGFVWLRRIDETVDKGLAAAIEAHPDVAGWVVDLRGNTGGGYDQTLKDLAGRLARPVAVLQDAGCVSAGETYIRDLVELADARRFGETTAGSSSSKKVVDLPSGLASIRYSVRSRSGPGGIPIEFNGIAPDVATEAVPEEVEAGKNSTLERALEWLREEGAKKR